MVPDQLKRGRTLSSTDSRKICLKILLTLFLTVIIDRIEHGETKNENNLELSSWKRRFLDKGDCIDYEIKITLRYKNKIQFLLFNSLI
jgi:hypothetical protein